MNDTVTSQSNCISTHAVSPLKQTIAMFLKNKGAVLGLMFLLLIVFVAIFGPFFIEEEPFSIVGAPFMAPMEDGFIFGTDYVGRDIFNYYFKLDSRKKIITGNASQVFNTSTD